MADSIAKADIAKAVRMIADAETVHVAGFRRSFPVAAYLAYSLQQAGKRMQFIDGVAGLALGHGPSIGSDDLLIARTERRCVGKEGVKTCNFSVTQEHKKK